MGLRLLLAKTAELDLPKSKKLSMSNWGAKTLTPAQVTYAGYDAWASAKIVDVLWKSNPSLDLCQDERPLEDVDVRARARKKAKTKWKQLKEIEGERTKEQRAEQDRLYQIMKEMRPDPPPTLNISIAERV